MMKENNVIQMKSFEFALSVIELYKKLIHQKEFILSKQLLRSGTSIWQILKALAAQSKKDFVSKMSIASKEARETKYWLKLLQSSQIIQNDFSNYINDVNGIINILTAIVKTSQSKF